MSRSSYFIVTAILIEIWMKSTSEELVISKSPNVQTSPGTWNEMIIPDMLSGLENSVSSFPKLNPSDNQYTSLLGLNTLRFVAVVSRHGSRTPLWTYPGDPTPYYNISLWPDGQEYMTRFGKQQMFLAGQRLRTAYNGFISRNYFVNETKVEAYELPRDFETAAIAMAGLYPPMGFQLWNPALLWNPIYIETIKDHLYEMTLNETSCPRFIEEITKILSEIDMRKYSDVVSTINTSVGSEYTDPLHLAIIYDTITMANENGYGIPEWSKYIYPESLKEIYTEVFDSMFSGSPVIMKLTAGPTMRKISSMLELKVAGRLQQRMYYLAGHDSDVRSILAFLGAAHPRYVETSAFLVTELHETSRGHFIRVLYYRDSSVLTPETVFLPSCGEPCTMKAFLSVISEQQVDKTSACAVENSQNVGQSSAITALHVSN